jgi:hypothetical protein
LRQNDEIIPEDKRVRDLLTGIKDQFLNAAKQIIMAFPDLRGDFAATDSHLAATIQMNAALTPDNQNISGVNSGRGEGQKPEFSWWQNQGRGRGGRNGQEGGGGGIYWNLLLLLP